MANHARNVAATTIRAIRKATLATWAERSHSRAIQTVPATVKVSIEGNATIEITAGHPKPFQIPRVRLTSAWTTRREAKLN